jgi:hypothetical protein
VELGTLRHVMVLTVKGNHMALPTVEVCDQGADSIVFFLKHVAMGACLSVFCFSVSSR